MWNNCQKLALFILVFSHTLCQAQSTFIPLNDDYYHLLDRYEIKSGKFSKTFHTGAKPYDRKAVILFLNETEAEHPGEWSGRDRYNIDYLRNDSWEWTADTLAYGIDEQGIRRKSRLLWGHPADLYSSRNEDFDIHVNFVTNNFAGKEKDVGRALLYSGRGVEVRGMINKKLGFYTYITDNQGYFPQYVQEYTEKLNFPGEGLTKIGMKKGVDFFSARGYITFNPLKSVNIQFGHDRNFFGNGYRSLTLSDNSSPYLFLKINTQIGRVRYTNLWTSMINNQDAPHGDMLRKKKYTAMHHLSVNITDRFNLGFFEAEVFSRDSTSGGFDLNYLNPVIFYRFVESYLGSSDNALLGIDFKWLTFKNFSTYGQLMVDEFLSKDYFNNDRSWTKKYGLQLGAKHIDALGIPHLDLQAEYNVVRPYTFTHRDGGRNYMHYKQALAHPLGANFWEVLGIARYQLGARLTAYGTIVIADRGVDAFGTNYGSDLTLDYDTRVSDKGNVITQGILEKTRMFDLRLSYMLAHNLFLDYRMMQRKVISSHTLLPSTSLVTFGVRYNLPYRQQLF